MGAANTFLRLIADRLPQLRTNKHTYPMNMQTVIAVKPAPRSRNCSKGLLCQDQRRRSRALAGRDTPLPIYLHRQPVFKAHTCVGPSLLFLHGLGHLGSVGLVSLTDTSRTELCLLPTNQLSL